MKKNSVWTRVISLVLVFVLGCTLLPNVTGTHAQAVQNIDSLLNTVTLHPQKTGYAALDKLLEQQLAPCKNMTNAQKIRYIYQWTVKNIDYSWAGYSAEGSGYNGFRQTYPYNDYDSTLVKAYPEETIARTYYTMTKHKGVCYDYAVVFSVMARYLGFEAYTHTGQYKFESWMYRNPGQGHHGWSVININGTQYIFDPQREYRATGNGKNAINYTSTPSRSFFGITKGDTMYANYIPTAKDNADNAARDASYLSLTAARQYVAISAVASESGSVKGARNYLMGKNATLIATPNSGKKFLGWYDENGNWLNGSTTFYPTVTKAATYYAMFEGDRFYDVKSSAWYYSDTMRAAQTGLVSGVTPIAFNASGCMTRAMTAKILANMEGADLTAYEGQSAFSDVSSSKWYAACIAWAKDTGVVNGYDNGTFQPDQAITREECMIMLDNYLTKRGLNAQTDMTYDQLTFSDKAKISEGARDAVCRMTSIGLLKGYEDGTIRAKTTITRAEGVTVLVRLMNYCAAAKADTQTAA